MKFEDMLNTITLGDCYDLIKNIPDKKVDMILCDLPYGTTRNEWDNIINLDLLWQEYERIIKDNGAILLTAQTPFDKILGNSNLKLLKYEWIWQKNKATGYLNAKKMPLKEHENILVFYKNLPVYNAQGLIKKEKSTINKGLRGRKKQGAGGTNYGKSVKDAIQTHSNYPKSILTFKVVMKPVHPTQKPVDLFEYLIKTYTRENEIVLDNCIGSGTTAIACINTNRNYIGFEIDKNYYEIALNRIKEAKND